MGDFVANAIAVTPEREKRFAFSVPIQTNVDPDRSERTRVWLVFHPQRTWQGRKSMSIRSQSPIRNFGS